MTNEKPDMALRIKNIAAGGMVDGIAAAILARYFLRKHLEIFGNLIDARLIGREIGRAHV